MDTGRIARETGDGSHDTVYRLAPGAEVLRTSDDTLTVKTAVASARLSGASAAFFEERVVPALDGVRGTAEIAAQTGLSDADSLADLLRGLNRAGVVLRVDGDRRGDPFLDVVEMLGVDREQTAERLAALRVFVLGDGALGRSIASQLAALPLGGLALGRLSTEESEDDVVPGVDGVMVDADDDSLREALSRYDYVVSTFGAALPALDHRVNRLIHESGIPALFCRGDAAGGTVGPLVFPGESACFTCWRMRTSACANDFGEHMDYRDAVAARTRPVDDPAARLPHLAAMIGGMVVNELLKATLALGQTTIVDKVVTFEPFRGGWSTHPLRRRADCPTCARKKSSGRNGQPALNDMEVETPADLLAHESSLVSDSTGIVRRLTRVHKDLSEPSSPRIYRAEIANHRFLAADDGATVIASGKGFTEEAAKLSALGEAMERYAASSWGEEIVLRGDAGSIGMDTLDPTRLVLFDDEQFARLDYDPWREDASIGWVPMRSLASGRELAVPALAVLMAYETVADEPYLFPITSNGLAAGATLERAILSGALECIERDAFLCTWLNRLPCRRLSPDDHPDADVRSMVLAYRRRGVELELYRLPTSGEIAVCMAVAVGEPSIEGPAAVVGLGAHHELARAAASALIETAQVRPSLRVRLRAPETRTRLEELLRDPRDVTSLEDHDLLYCDHAMLGCFDFVREAPVERADWTGDRVDADASRLRGLVEHLQDEGSDLLYADLTSEDVRDTGVRVVRVVLPDYQPMHFGFAERRLAARRLYEMPLRLGLADEMSTASTLNPFPHPLA